MAMTWLRALLRMDKPEAGGLETRGHRAARFNTRERARDDSQGLVSGGSGGAVAKAVAPVMRQTILAGGTRGLFPPIDETRTL